MPETYTCQCCGKTYKKILMPEAYLGSNCHDCSFWLKKTEYTGVVASRRAIINGEHYMVYAETDGLIKGSGGRRVIVEFFDGRIIHSNNLWHQGTIPERFREMLPDSAIFIPVETVPVLDADKSGIPFFFKETKMIFDFDWFDNFDLADIGLAGALFEELSEDEKNKIKVEKDFSDDEMDHDEDYT